MARAVKAAIRLISLLSLESEGIELQRLATVFPDDLAGNRCAHEVQE